jgi:hypothetical protein
LHTSNAPAQRARGSAGCPPSAPDQGLRGAMGSRPSTCARV